jgi:hypothetical protein
VPVVTQQAYSGGGHGHHLEATFFQPFGSLYLPRGNVGGDVWPATGAQYWQLAAGKYGLHQPGA